MAKRLRMYLKRPPMTIGRLHRELGKLMQKVGGRAPVCIDKRTFVHPLESDGVCFLSAHGVESKYITIMDDDGGTKTTKAGREVGSTHVVLIGWECNPEQEPRP